MRRGVNQCNSPECGVGGQPYKTPHFHLRHRHPPAEWPSQEEPGSGFTAFAPVSGVPLLFVQMGYGLLCGLWVWRRTSRRPCCPPMSNPSTSTWTARPDVSGRWDNWMDAQHLPRDLVRPSSGLKELTQTKKKRKRTDMRVENMKKGKPKNGVFGCMNIVW